MSASRNLLATCDVRAWFSRLSRTEAARLKNRAKEAILVATIDGFKEYADKYPEKAEEKRDLHHRLCCRHIESFQGQILAQASDGAWFDDAILASFSNPLGFYRAIAAAVAMYRAMMNWSLEHWQSDRGVVWEHQVHSRMVVCTGSWVDTLQLLQQAHRGEILIPKTDLTQLTETESMLLRASAKIRSGVSMAAWEELKEEASDCFGLIHHSEHEAPKPTSANSRR